MSLDLDDRKCKFCGKVFTVLHPDRWAYKQTMGKKYTWFCSWKCLRAYEKKAPAPERKIRTMKEAYELENNRRRDPREVIQRMLAAMEEGTDPRAFLRDLGYINPTDQLKKLRNWAEKNDPKAADTLKKIPPAKKGPAKGTKKEPRVIGRVVEKKEKAGGVAVKVEKLPEEARPKPMDGGEWVNIRDMPGPVLKEAPLPDPVPMLKVAGLESKAIEKATWVRTGEMITLNSGSETDMSLKPEQWRKLSTEIKTMLEQFGA